MKNLGKEYVFKDDLEMLEEEDTKFFKLKAAWNKMIEDAFVDSIGCDISVSDSNLMTMTSNLNDIIDVLLLKHLRNLVNLTLHHRGHHILELRELVVVGGAGRIGGFRLRRHGSARAK